VSQVNRAMSQVDQVTQQTASAAEQLSATADHMAAEAEDLHNIVGRFRLDGTNFAQESHRKEQAAHQRSQDSRDGTKLQRSANEGLAASDARPIPSTPWVEAQRSRLDQLKEL
ncbi:MAG TPA: methyl-accepting chemotaxis protein, partial [Acidobacteriota bacterium]|nr:methyl-accepting chemotaxis protein [Acidobacteriota bacterium]